MWIIFYFILFKLMFWKYMLVNQSQKYLNFHLPTVCWIYTCITSWSAWYNWITAIDNSAFTYWKCSQTIEIITLSRIVWSLGKRANAWSNMVRNWKKKNNNIHQYRIWIKDTFPKKKSLLLYFSLTTSFILYTQIKFYHI